MMNRFVKGWFERGQKEDAGSIFQFFCYFIAFNFLYDKYTGHDRHKLEKLVEKDIIPLLSNEASAILEEGAAFYDEPGPCFRSERPVAKLTRESPLKDVFLNIYQVRCNLFHGSKAMDTPRDIALVSTSANVLQRFLGRWLEKNGGLR
ncbi:MAG: hypothetical protein PHG06_16770 [Parabacteroides sp.]|jgi:hypothetical protein|nr:hypothetical protein [Parabacteroides sp.]